MSRVLLSKFSKYIQIYPDLKELEQFFKRKFKGRFILSEFTYV